MRGVIVSLFTGLALILSACGGESSLSGVPTATTPPSPTNTTAPAPAGPTITMGVASFIGSTTLAIKAGEAVTFDDPASSGGVHKLVTGMHGTFTAEPGAPDGFASASGIAFSPGDRKTITFPTAATYHITCTIHPTMQATITVT